MSRGLGASQLAETRPLRPSAGAGPARVLVLDGHSAAALAFVRSLGRAGHWVAVGSAGDSPAYAGLSRYCRRAWTYPPPTAGAPAFLDAIGRFCRDHGIDLIAPMTDATTWPVSTARDALPAGVIVAAGPPESLSAANDKYRTVELGRENGIPVPETRLIRSAADLREIDWGFPVVVKDRHSMRWVEGRGVPGKVAYAYSRRELEEAVGRRLDLVGDVMVQRFVQGEGIGFAGFVAEGSVRLPFLWRRLREKDPRGSGSSARRSLPPDGPLADSAARLLRAAGFQGIAMVEFKRSAADGRDVLMEINGRPWGSLQLPISCGIDYPRHAARWYLEGALPPESVPYRVGITCRCLASDMVHLENVWAGPPAGWPLPYPRFLPTALKVAAPWHPGLRYEDFAAADPRPGLAQLGDWIRSHLKRPRR